MTAWDMTIFDRNGNPLDEIQTNPVVHWSMNGHGWLEFTLSGAELKLRESLLRFRNPVLFRHDTAGWWGGILWTPRGWDRRKATFKAYSAEYLFKLRRGPANITWTGSAGAIYKQIIKAANAPEDTRIREGNIWMGGTSRQETCRDDILYDALLRVQERSGDDWYLTPELDSNGKLTFEAHWFERAGEQNVFNLSEGVNVKISADDKLLLEQGQIVNDVVFSGIGASIESRPRAVWLDQASVDKYGVCQGSENSDAEEVSTLLAHAKAFVAEHKEPRRTLSVAAQDVRMPDGQMTFEGLSLGNTGRLAYFKTGFYGDAETGTETTVRILEKELATKTQFMELIVDEVTE